MRLRLIGLIGFVDLILIVFNLVDNFSDRRSGLHWWLLPDWGLNAL